MKSRVTINGRIFKWEEGLLSYIEKSGKIITSIGLSEENWKEDPVYWSQKYNDELDEEVKYLMKEAEQEFGGTNARN